MCGASPAIEEVLYLRSRQYGRTILFLDRFSVDELAESIAKLDPIPTMCVLDDPLFNDDPYKAPLLVELSHCEASHHVLLGQSIEVAQHEALDLRGVRSICGWLYSDVSLNLLGRALRQRLCAKYPDGQKIYFRYFDPRVMPHLGVLSPEQLLGPVKAWYFLDSDGCLQLQQHEVPATPSPPGILFLDAIMSAAIDRIAVVNQTLCALKQHAQPGTQKDWDNIDQHVRASEHLGLRDPDDQVAYAWRAVSYGPAFTADPAVSESVALADKLGIPFDIVLEQRYPSFATGPSAA